MYLLDEIDAALDQSNQKAVARLVSKHFAGRASASKRSSSTNTLSAPPSSQIICISHHPAFHSHGERAIQIAKAEGSDEAEEDGATGGRGSGGTSRVLKVVDRKSRT